MEFVANVEEIRARARKKIEEGALTQDYSLDKDQVIEILNEALATEIVCTLRYRFHYFAATGIHSAAVAEEFLEHANEEQGHADMIARRIKQLGGKPEMNPAIIAKKAHSEYIEGNTLSEMLREDLVAERIAIETYREMINFFSDKDPTSRRMIEDILAVEEEHADELADLLFAIEPDTEKANRLYFKDEIPNKSETVKPGTASKAAAAQKRIGK
jgi:bacterioferritin